MTETRARAEARYWEARIKAVEAERDLAVQKLLIAVNALQSIVTQRDQSLARQPVSVWHVADDALIQIISLVEMPDVG